MSPDLAWDDELRSIAFSTLFDENVDAMYVMDITGRFIAGNGAFASLLQMPWEDIRSTDFTPLVHPDDLPRVTTAFLTATAGETVTYDSRAVRPDGSIVNVEAVLAPVRRDGEVVALIGAAHISDDLVDARMSLDRSEALLRIASRIARLGGWSYDVASREGSWSPEIDELLGVSAERTPHSDRVLDLLDPADREQLNLAYAACLRDGDPIDLTVQFHLADGRHLHTRVFAEAVRDDTGRVTQVEGALMDITEEVRARRERQELETRLISALDGLGDVMAFVDADWRITFLNTPAIRLLGHGDRNLIGTSLWDLNLPDPEGAEMLREVMRTRRTLVHRRFDSDLQRWMEITGFPAGDLLGIQVRDVTEIEEARRRIIDDSRRLHAQVTLLDSAPDAIFMRGLGDVIEYANPGAASLFGESEAPFVGRSLSEVLKLDDATARAAEADLGREGSWSTDLIVRRADGTERIAECRLQVVRSPDGTPEAVFALVSDVTDRRKQDEVLARTQRMESIGTLASGIAHDLNNVLTPLLLSTQLLAAGETDPARMRLLDGMRQTIDRGANMIRQVLTFARGVEGERVPVDIAELTDRFADFCRDILPKEIDVQVSAEPGLAVLGDPTQLLQVLMNLATNARDAMPDGGSLRLTATAHGDRVRVDVTDDGEGMSPDVLARVFEPFYTTKGIGSGTGLGLSVSQAIVRTHGGSLEASSEPGVGTTFHVLLPRIDGASTSEQTEGQMPIPDLDGLRVLIVDDEDEIREIATMVVANSGGTAFGARDGVHAQTLLGDTEVDVIVTDMVMPGTTGRAFLDWLAETHPTIPVVAMSGVPEQGANAALRDNVRSSLDKPFTAETLIDAIRSAADRS